MIRPALIVIGALVALFLLVVAIGWMLPVAHRATRSATFDATPSEVFALIAGFQDYPGWRSDVTRVEILSERDPLRFREHGSQGAIAYEMVERQPDRRMVVRIVDQGLPYGGQWTYEVLPEAAGTTLRITEDGEVYNPVFRFMSRFVFGHTRTLKNYLRDAGAALRG